MSNSGQNRQACSKCGGNLVKVIIQEPKSNIEGDLVVSGLACEKCGLIPESERLWSQTEAFRDPFDHHYH